MPVYSRVRRERKEVTQVILVINHRVSVRSGRLQKMETGEDNRGNRVIKCCTVFNPSTWSKLSGWVTRGVAAAVPPGV